MNSLIEARDLLHVLEGEYHVYIRTSLEEHDLKHVTWRLWITISGIFRALPGRWVSRYHG